MLWSVLGKVEKGSYWEVNVWRWLLGGLGNQRPHGRRVITPAHEGAMSSVWQSSHNSGLIHHMGIMPLTGTTPKKSYTRSSPASKSLNSPIPLLSTHSVSGWNERVNEQELLTERKKHLSWAVSQSEGGPFVEKWLCSFCSSQNNLLLMALITGLSRGSYQLSFSCLGFNMSPLWKSSRSPTTFTSQTAQCPSINWAGRPGSGSSLIQD